jgi:CheY-like chemotaxis protein
MSLKSYRMPKPLHVYLIDDDSDDHYFFKLAVEDMDAGIECTFASGGDEALERLKDSGFKPDFIFIDINMRGMNGMEVLTEIRKLVHLNHTVVYMYSTSANEQLKSTFTSLGATGVIRKVASIALLKDMLLTLFQPLQLR